MSKQEKRALPVAVAKEGPKSAREKNAHNANNGLDLCADNPLNVDGPGGPDLAIERVEIEYVEGPVDPAAQATIEGLMARWLMRAYLRKYAQDGAEPAVLDT